jgi:hypothetical protein
MKARIICESKGGRRQFHGTGHRQAEQGKLLCHSQSRADGIELINREQVEQGRAGEELSAAQSIQDRCQDPDICGQRRVR